MIKPEILAPVGGSEQLVAAVRCGADAVYLGTKNFNVRNSAENFDEAALKEAVCYCHARNVKVYVTMNTLVTDSETDDVINEIKMIARCGADAVIIQDLAVAALWKEYCPSMPLHASTQMTIHNLQGAKAAEKLGFRRLVLARELSKNEIKTIAENVNAEIEIFVHGALCMSISGTCLLSSMIGTRSGNRGRCAQPCRLNFKINNREYALSLKDLSLVDNLAELAEIGVASLKIEGRMKRPEYVAAAVTAIRSKLDGNFFDTDKLQAVFSRSGFTKGYFESKRTLEMFGYRKKEDVTAAAGVLKELAVLYKDEIRKVPVTMHLEAKKAFTRLTVTDDKNTVTIDGAGAQDAINKPLDEEYAEKSLAKTGGTVFFADKLTFDIENNISLSASQMNTMRRDALEKLYNLRHTSAAHEIVNPEKKPFSATLHADSCAFRLRFERYSQSFNDPRADRIILPMREILRNPEAVEKYGNKLIAELPFLVFAQDEDRFTESLSKLREMGVNHVIADNIGTLAAAVNMDFTAHGGHGLNILNSLSAREYEKLGVTDFTVSPELNMNLIEKLSSGRQKGVIGYGFLPLMRFRACPAQKYDGCASCKGLSVVTDRMNTTFYLLCSEKKYSSLLNSVPVYIGDKKFRNVDFATLYFTFEKEENCRKIFDAYASAQSLPIRKTGGLYYRELL